MTKKIFVCLVVFCIFLTTIYGTEENYTESIELNSLTDILDEYVQDFKLDEIKEDLLLGKGIDYGLIGNSIVKAFTEEINIVLKGTISIIVVIILVAILKALELEEGSGISKTAFMVAFLVIISIVIVTFGDVMQLFTSRINITTKIVQAVSPFLMALLMATGAIVSTGILQPIILFLIGSIGVLVNYIVVPLLTISLVFSLVSEMTDGLKFNRLAMLCSKSGIWIITVVFALVIGVLGLESSIGTSIDGVTVKTTQAAISNVIPVVGKFVADSAEVIFGSAQIIGNVAGTVGIITLVIVMLPPIIKILVIILMYILLTCIAEGVGEDKKITGLLENITSIYKTMLGIMIGVMSLFIVAVGIIMSLMGKVAG